MGIGGPDLNPPQIVIDYYDAMNDNAHQYQGYQVLQLRQLLIFI
jgi:hypothetical protein